MKTELNDILIYYYTSKTLERVFTKIKSSDRDDLKSYILDIIIDNVEKMTLAYDGGYFDKYIHSIINNQYNSITSPFRRKFLYGGDKPTLELLINDNSVYNQDNLIEEEGNDFDAELEIIKIKSILSNTHWSKATLFKMYYFDKLTYREISEKTGIYYLKIRQSVMTTLEEVKVKLNNL